ncbi:BZ3500_MvSof-1268-A1-R1_Chr1-1g00913 [Microbotryum saponariae]|uniref:BZ3500_MvSof-1268-A1-R1_Chr1-1g00913 protein n=1 Tax=Microbotryum saponariae TaxID=289078 RepID=A0A2X0L0J3_9BASI|nr:BZ3500_MvSof-1268-A1-R1_Chr1-1g00913 [Microbotryum saponariae]
MVATTEHRRRRRRLARQRRWNRQRSRVGRCGGRHRTEARTPESPAGGAFIFFDILRTQNPENRRGALQKIDILGRNTRFAPEAPLQILTFFPGTRLPLGADRLWSQYDRAEDVQSWALRAQRWMDKIVVINGTDRNRIAVARRILNGLQWQEQDGLLPLPLLGGGTSLVYLLRFLSQQLAYSRLYSGHDWLGEAAMNLSIESVLRAGRVQNPDSETSYGLIPSTVISLLLARPSGSGPHSIFKAWPAKPIGSLICFGLKRGMHSLSCDQTAYGEETLSIGIVRYIYSKVTTNHCNRDTLPSLKACYSTHLIDGTMPFRMIDGRQVIESLGPPATTYRSTTDLTSCYPDERIISTCAHAEQRFAAFRSVPGLRDAAAHQQSKEGLFDAWSHARHQPKRRAPQATFDRPPRVRKRSERVFEDF